MEGIKFWLKFWPPISDESVIENLSCFEKITFTKDSFSKTHIDYNYLQSILKQKLFTTIIKMPSRKAWVERS
jgi:hypothetical protein